MVAKKQTRTNSEHLALIGTGSQSEFQALALRGVLGIEKLTVWDTVPAAMEKFANHMRPLGFDITVAHSGADAVRGADLVTTCTADKSKATILTADLLEPGMHLNAICGDCPARQNWTPRSFVAGTFLSSLIRKPASKGKLSRCRPVLPSPSSGGC